MPDVTIRDATPEDLPRMRELFRHLEEAQGPYRPIKPGPDVEERAVAGFEAAMASEDARVLLAEVDGVVLGMAIAELGGGSRLSADRVVELRRVVVDPAARGAGVGTALIEAAEEFARSLGAGWLGATFFSLNDRGRRFWESRGFEPAWETKLRRIPRD